MKPLLSVVTITYNHEPYIEKCIKGVLMQKVNFPIEFIIAEDCSTDGTRKICERFAKEYPDKIRLITSDANIGGLANEKRAMEVACGKYIAFCEGDDYWTDPDKLAKQVEFLESHPDYTVCFHDRMILKNGSITHKDAFAKFRKTGEDGFELTLPMFYNNWIAFPFTMVFRRSAFEIGWYEKYRMFRDSHMVFHFLQKGKGYVFDFIGGVRTVHTDSMFHSMDRFEIARTDMLVYQELYRANRHTPQGVGLKHEYVERIKCCIDNAQRAHKGKIYQFRLALKLFFLEGSLKTFVKSVLSVK